MAEQAQGGTDGVANEAASAIGRAPIAWRPTPEQAGASQLGRFMAAHGIATYETLLTRSTADPEWFWQAVVDELRLQWFTPYERVLDLSEGIPFARWFPGGRYNYVRNAVDRWAASPRAKQPALIWEGEDGATRTLSYAELDDAVCRLANGLRALGIGAGDRVGIFMPMTPETAVATLAVSKIGAIYTPIFSGYGAAAVAARLADCEARLLITADGFPRRGNVVPMKETADEAVSQVPSVERMIVFSRLGRDVPWTPERDIWWEHVVRDQPAECPTEPTAGDDPFMIIYTSGTTGRPKGALHVHHGFPLKATQDMAHCFDVGAGDRLFWLTDLGWMMGPWAIQGASRSAPRSSCSRAAPISRGPTASGTSSSGTRPRTSASPRPPSAASCGTARSRSSATT